MPSEPGAPLPPIRLVRQTGSTNDDVAEMGRSGAPHGSAVAARAQTAGRGRRGHVWESPEGGLYLSVLLRPEVPMQQLMGIAAVGAMGALDALRSLGAERVALKWPNDVVAGPEPGAGKVAGVLAEAGYGDGGTFAVFGIGVNLSRGGIGDLAGCGTARPLEPACLEDAMRGGTAAPGLEDLAEAIRDAVVERCDGWSAEVRAGHAAAGPLAPILSEYFDRMPLLGRQVMAVLPDGRVACRGVFAGVDVWGRATVHLADGSDVEFASEQASLRELQGPA